MSPYFKIVWTKPTAKAEYIFLAVFLFFPDVNCASSLAEHVNDTIEKFSLQFGFEL